MDIKRTLRTSSRGLDGSTRATSSPKQSLERLRKRSATSSPKGSMDLEAARVALASGMSPRNSAELGGRGLGVMIGTAVGEGEVTGEGVGFRPAPAADMEAVRAILSKSSLF